MSEEEILSQLGAVTKGFEALKVEHQYILDGISITPEEEEKMETAVNQTKRACIEKSLDILHLGLEEAKAMSTVYAHIQSLEADKNVQRLKTKQLYKENVWLRDELATAQQKLQACELMTAQLEEEKKHLEFMNQMKKKNGNERGESKWRLLSNMPSCSFDNNVDSDKNNLGGGIVDVAQTRLDTLRNLIMQFVSQGQSEVAIALCKQALSDLENITGHNHPDVANMLNILAFIYRDQKKYKEATNLLLDALKIREKTLGENDPTVLATLNNLAVFYGKRAKYNEAVSLCKRALEIREKVFGIDHLDVAKQLNNLAVLCQKQGNYDEVETYYRRALEIYETKLGPEDPNVTKTKKSLADACRLQGRHQEADLIYKEM